MFKIIGLVLGLIYMGIAAYLWHTDCQEIAVGLIAFFSFLSFWHSKTED